MPMHPHYKLASLVISNLYSNIPIHDTKMILDNKHSGTDTQTQQELLMWYIITRQNYFAHKNIMTQQDGLAMGAPHPPPRD
jgi:hypothetical protein